jgi:hypothetical protein
MWTTHRSRPLILTFVLKLISESRPGRFRGQKTPILWAWWQADGASVEF